MNSSTTIQVRGKGSLTLPVEVRRKYGVNEGDVYTLIDVGEGAFMLVPQVTTVDRLGSRVAELVAEQGTSLEELLETLDEERQRYYQERYARD
jgi:bifunctional DNA-binding transcriptional regulator/antitoxin component of YhaV-PrlF toxin-antitoxin module